MYKKEVLAVATVLATIFVKARADEDCIMCGGLNESVRCLPDYPPEWTCDNRRIAFKYPSSELECRYKCVCDPGFYRNSKNRCIDFDLCAIDP